MNEFREKLAVMGGIFYDVLRQISRINVCDSADSIVKDTMFLFERRAHLVLRNTRRITYIFSSGTLFA